MADDASLKEGMQAIFSEFGHTIMPAKATKAADGAEPKTKKRSREKKDKKRAKAPPSADGPNAVLSASRPGKQGAAPATGREPAVVFRAALPTTDADGDALHGSEAAAKMRQAQRAAAVKLAGQGKRMTFDDDGDAHDAVPAAVAEDAVEARASAAKPFRPSGSLGTGKEAETWFEMLERMEGQAGIVRKPATSSASLLAASNVPLGGLNSDRQYAEVEAEAEAALAAEVAKRADRLSKMRGQGSSQWMERVLERGTFGDKVAALALTVTEAPVQSLAQLDHLIGLARKPGRRDTTRQVMEALRDVFLSALLPSDRKLRPFHAQPLKQSRHRPDILVLFRFEDRLRERYSAYVGTLQAASSDAQPWFRKAAVQQAFDLLSERPEAEAALLGLVVNKLGDSDRKVSAHAMRVLQQLLHKHPAMQPVVVREVRQFLSRPKNTARAQYQATLTLSQLVLSRHFPQTALALVATYFDIIARALGADDHKPAATTAAESTGNAKDGYADGAVGSHSKLITAALTGVNRAFPFARPMLFEAAQTDAASSTSAPESTTSVAVAGKETPESLRAALFARVDQLFRLVHQAGVSTSIQALGLLFQVMAAQKTLSDRFYRALYAKLRDPAVLAASGKHALLLNLVFRALAADSDIPRQRAMVKRLCQLGLSGPPQLAAAVVFLVAKVHSARPGVASAVSKPEPDQRADADKASVASSSSSSSSSAAAAAAVGSGSVSKTAIYDAQKRDPRFAGAELTCLWELTALQSHFHPSVRRFATAALQGAVEYEGDPLADFSLMAFLDRFSYRNPKKLAVVAAQGTSALDRRQLAYAKASGKDLSREYAAAKGQLHGDALQQKRSARTGRTAVEAPATSRAFQALPEAAVREDDMFLHRYFRLAAQAKKDAEGAGGKSAKSEERQRRADELAAQMVDEGGEEEEFARALAESLMKEADADGDEDEDLGQYDYDEDDEDDEDVAGNEGSSDNADAEGEGDDDDAGDMSAVDSARLAALLKAEAGSLAQPYHDKEKGAARLARGVAHDEDDDEDDDDDEAGLFAAMVGDDDDDDDDDDNDGNHDGDDAMGKGDEQEAGGKEHAASAERSGRRSGGAASGGFSAFASLDDFLGQIEEADEQFQPDTSLQPKANERAGAGRRRGKRVKRS